MGWSGQAEGALLGFRLRERQPGPRQEAEAGSVEGRAVGYRRLPTSTRVASESGGIFSKIPDDERPSVSPFPCWEAGGEERTQLPPSLPTLVSNHVQVGAFQLSHTPLASPVHRRAVSPARVVGGAEAVWGPLNASRLWASHPPGPLGLPHGCRTHRRQGLSTLSGGAISRVKTGDVCVWRGGCQEGLLSDQTRETPGRKENQPLLKDAVDVSW